MNSKHYIIDKKKYKEEVINIDTNKLNGFQILPQNKVEYPGVEVNSMLVVKPSFIEKILKKKIKRKLDYYLNYIINIIDSSDSDPDDAPLRQALNDLTRYKEMVENKYQKYLDDKYISLLMKKITLLERELKTKIVYKTMNKYEPIYEENKGKSR